MRACAAELTVRPAHLPHAFVLERGGAVLGFCAWAAIDAARAELEFMFVEPRSIGGGHGRALMDYVRADVAKHGHRLLEILGDPNADHFYRAAGARHVGERESSSIPGRKLPLYELDVVPRAPD